MRCNRGPRSYTFWHRSGGEPLRLIVDQVRLEPERQGEPGTVLVAEGDTLLVAAGKGALAIEKIQPAGKRSMAAGEFLRGNAVQAGDRLGPQ